MQQDFPPGGGTERTRGRKESGLHFNRRIPKKKFPLFPRPFSLLLCWPVDMSSRAHQGSHIKCQKKLFKNIFYIKLGKYTLSRFFAKKTTLSIPLPPEGPFTVLLAPSPSSSSSLELRNFAWQAGEDESGGHGTDGRTRATKCETFDKFRKKHNRNVSLGLIVRLSPWVMEFQDFFLNWQIPILDFPPHLTLSFFPLAVLCGEIFFRELKVFCGCENCRQRFFYGATVEAAFSFQQQFGDCATLSRLFSKKCTVTFIKKWCYDGITQQLERELCAWVRKSQPSFLGGPLRLGN